MFIDLQDARDLSSTSVGRRNAESSLSTISYARAHTRGVMKNDLFLVIICEVREKGLVLPLSISLLCFTSMC